MEGKMNKVIIILIALILSVSILRAEDNSQADDVTIKFNVDDKLSGKSRNSYALTVERLMLFFGAKVDVSYLNLVNSIEFERLRGFGSVNTKMEAFIDFSKHEGRIAGLKIKKLYMMKDSNLRGLIRLYNSYAKKEKKPQISLKGKCTNVFYNGIRDDFIKLDPELRQKARKKSCSSKFVATIKRYVDKGVPVVWCPVFGSRESGVKSPIYLITGYNDNTKEIIYLAKTATPQRIKYEEAWGLTTGLLTIKPRVNKK
jgi:hypothetical protein